MSKLVSITEIVERFKASSNDELAAKSGMVCQLWSDGEITLQKSGDLLGQRTLHCIAPALLDAGNHLLESELRKAAPHDNATGYGFIYCQSEDAELIRDLMKEYA